MSAAHTSAVLGRRVCAVLAVTSAALHAAMLGHAANPAGAAVMVAMIAGCLYCAYDLWTRAPLRAWVVVALMNIAMIVLHLPAPTHHHGGGTAPAAAPGTVMGLATVLATVEVTAAAAVLYFRTRGRDPMLTGTPTH
jgi:hypothetical protein